jgi:hypothetical protein
MAPAAIASARSAHGHETAPRWISRPVQAPHRFDLVGVAREMRTVQIRVRDDGGHWTDWVDQDDGTPIYVGGADVAQVRAPFRQAAVQKRIKHFAKGRKKKHKKRNSGGVAG